MLIRSLLIAAFLLFVGGSFSSTSYAEGATSRPAVKATKTKWTADQCRKRCDTIWMLGRERSVCYAKVCSRYQ